MFKAVPKDLEISLIFWYFFRLDTIYLKVASREFSAYNLAISELLKYLFTCVVIPWFHSRSSAAKLFEFSEVLAVVVISYSYTSCLPRHLHGGLINCFDCSRNYFMIPRSTSFIDWGDNLNGPA